MVALSFGDEVSVGVSSSDSFVCNVKEISGSSNLALKALDLFRQKTGVTTPVTISLKKRIPVGSGMGGGSSNAATVLFALNQIFSVGFSSEQLASMGAHLGSDIPFFFSLGEALCSGRGDVVTTLSEGSIEIAKRFLLVFDNRGVSSDAAYQAFSAKYSPSTENLFELAKNDLEDPVFSFRQDLCRKKKFLQETFSESQVVMSGSGATLVVFSPSRLEEKTPLIFEGSPLRYALAEKIVREKGSWYQSNNFSYN